MSQGDEGATDGVIASNLKLIVEGIRVSVTATSKLSVAAAITREDCRRQDYYQLHDPATGREVQFKDYAPDLFNAFRLDVLGLSESDYLSHWASDDHSASPSAGRSGSMFCKSADKWMMLKTLQHAEVLAFRAMMYDYVEHVRRHPHSLLMRVVGLHRLKSAASKIWVIVFANSLPVNMPLSEVLDLKGRRPKRGKSLRERGRFTPKRAPRKDNELEQGLLFRDGADRTQYISRINRDVGFLVQHNLMDYSLLVGIYRGAAAEPPDGHRATLISVVGRHTAICEDPQNIAMETLIALGGVPGLNPKTGLPECYFFGIIDCLTAFSTKKIAAFAMKRLLWDKDTLSTVNANFYGRRFLFFMTQNLLTEKDIDYRKPPPSS